MIAMFAGVIVAVDGGSLWWCVRVKADDKMQYDRRLQSRLESLLFKSWGACRPSKAGACPRYYWLLPITSSR